MDYQVLNTELTTDPLSRGYAGMTDEQAAADLNTVYRQRNRTTMTGSELWENTDSTELDALTDTQRSQWISFCGIDSHDPFGMSASFGVSIFGGGSQTASNIGAARVESISRATELVGADVRVGDVQFARTL